MIIFNENYLFLNYLFKITVKIGLVFECLYSVIWFCSKDFCHIFYNDKSADISQHQTFNFEKITASVLRRYYGYDVDSNLYFMIA